MMGRWLGICGSALLVIANLSCTSVQQKSPPTVAPMTAKQELARVEKDISSGNDKHAVPRLKTLITKHPKSDVADDATLQLARVQANRGEFEAAYQTYMSLVNSDFFSANEADALLGAARALQKLGRLDEALALNARGLKIPGLNEAQKLDFHRLRYLLTTALGERLDALREIGYLQSFEPKADLRATMQARGLEMVGNGLNQSELEKAVDQSEFAFVRAAMAYRLGLFHLQAKDFDGARAWFGHALEWGQGTPVQHQAETYLAQLDSRRKVDPYTIGAVLPLTGKYAAMAQKTLRGLQLGLGLNGGSEKSPFKLAVVDSEGTAEGARHAVERLVTEDNAMAIVGSLLSRTATAVASKAEELGVPSIALSQKAGLTEAGTYVFRNALTSEMQVRDLVRLAMEQLGYKRFAILYPNDSYGVEYANLFWDEVLARGGTVSGAQPYSPAETDFRGPIRRLVGTYYLEDRRAEYENRLRDWYKKQKSLKGRNSPPDDLLPPVVDFDALFVPDSPKAIGQIAPMLAYQGITGTRLLGTNLWNGTELIRRGQKNVERALFVDSNLLNDSGFKNSRFYRDYKRLFGEEPGLFEVQGYESAMMLRQVIQAGESTRVGLAQRLNTLHDFASVNGPVSMSTQRELQRPLTAFVVARGSITPWSPAVEAELTAADPHRARSETNSDAQ